MAIYNLTNLTSNPTAANITTFANQVSNGFLFGGLSIALFFIIMLSLKKYEFSSGLLVASFLSFLVAAIAAYGGYLNIVFPLAYLALLAFTGFYKWIVEN